MVLLGSVVEWFLCIGGPKLAGMMSDDSLMDESVWIATCVESDNRIGIVRGWLGFLDELTRMVNWFVNKA